MEEKQQMANGKLTALMDARLGSRVAEDEVDSLYQYFVETEQWRKLYAGDVDIVLVQKARERALFTRYWCRRRICCA